MTRDGPVTSCPDCGAPVRPGVERLCPRCGYPLMFLDTTPDDSEVGIARMPGERDDGTAVQHVAAPARPDWSTLAVDDTPPDGNQVVCRRCGHHNPLTRVRCERCGAELRSSAPVPAALPPVPPRAPIRRRRWLLPTAVVAVVVILATGTAFAVSRLRDGGAPTGPGAPSAPGARTGLTPVPGGDIEARASSINAEEPRFRVANLLDGRAATVWQSDGKRLKTNVGVRLTFRFARSVRLARVTMVNGDGRTAQAFRQNERVARLSVRTDAGAVTWKLADSPEPQSLDLDPVTTSSVTLVVEAVHKGERWDDLAVSDVGFAERR